MEANNEEPFEEKCQNIPRFIKYHLTFFQLFGFVPIKFSIRTINSTTSKILVSTAATKNVIAQLLILFSYIYQDYIFFNGYGFGKFCDIFKVGFCAIAYEVLFIECLWNGEAEQVIYKLMLQVYAKNAIMTLSSFKVFMVKVYAYAAIWLSLESFYVYVKKDDQQSVNIWCIYNFLVFAARFRTLHFMFILKIISCKAESLNADLRAVVDESKFQRNYLNLKKQLSILRRRHSDLLRMIELFNEAFKWGLIFNHFRIYTKLIVDIYWNMFVYYMHTDPIEVYAIIPTIIELSILLGVGESLEKEFSKIGDLIHDVEIDNQDDIRIHTENFSLQVLSGPYQIKALGCFVYNCGAGKNMISSLLTQIIFFMQFMPLFLKFCMDNECF